MASLVFPNLMFGTTYTFHAVAADPDLGNSTASAPAEAATIDLPSPTLLSVTMDTPSSASLSWTAVPMASFYTVKATDSDGSTITQTVSDNSITDVTMNVMPGRNYTFTVAANGGGSTSTSAPVDISTTATPSDPSNVVAILNGYTAATITWDASQNDEADTYVIEASQNGGAFSPIGSPVSSATTSYTASGLQDGSTYQFRIYAQNVAGQSSTLTSNIVQMPPALEVPTNVVAKPLSSDSANVTWTDNSSQESGYLIQWWANGTPVLSHSFRVGSDVTNYVVGDLQAGQAYWFQVTTLRSDGATAAAAAVSMGTGLASTTGSDGGATDGGATDKRSNLRLRDCSNSVVCRAAFSAGDRGLLGRQRRQ